MKQAQNIFIISPMKDSLFEEPKIIGHSKVIEKNPTCLKKYYTVHKPKSL
jgi:hypothetical protein